MCGIAGIWHRDGRPVERRTLERMAKLLVHRGPDGEGFHLDGSLGLAHRRLAVIDPRPEADQPMGDGEGRWWLTYNGEIHNYRELRAELEGEGVRFRTQSDTEVVLASLARWGPDAFERWNGMWALAVWDRDRQRLLLSRDRFGMKPLYYSLRGARLAFASEAKALVDPFPEEREADRAELRRFLVGASPDVGPRTFFRNVRAVPAGCWIEFDGAGGCIEPRRYWSFELGVEEARPDAAAEFEWLLADAVRLRMRSDVPVAACLSGGLDSSAVVILAARDAREPMECVTLRYPGRAFDESHFAEEAASRAGLTRLHYVEPPAEPFLETLDRITWHHDAPHPLRGRYPSWFVFESLQRHAKVALVGEGADELLAGYDHYFAAHLLDRLRAPGGLTRPQAWHELSRLAGVAGLGRAFKSLLRPWKLLVRLDAPGSHGLLGPALRRTSPASDPRAHFGTWLRSDVERPFPSHLNNALWGEFAFSGLPELLHGQDSVSMAHSVESRMPFLDHRLVEFLFRLPPGEKIGSGWTKWVMRRALAALLPEAIRGRVVKQGFPAPYTEWLRRPGNLGPLRELLLDPACVARGVTAPRRVERFLREFERGRGGWRGVGAELLWRMAGIELWHRRFIDR